MNTGINKDLIYDVGMHDGSDTAYYLHKGFRVVAIDANPVLTDAAARHFKKYVDEGKLTLLNIAIADQEETLVFNISKNDIWSSLDKNVANREGLLLKQIEVQAQRLSSVFRTHGTPAYCKIDIEGYDAVALQTISKQEATPEYLSVESESLAEGVTINEEEALFTLKLLRELGYREFKLVDQSTMQPLSPAKRFYSEPAKVNMSLPARGIRYLQRKLGLNKVQDYRYHLSRQHDFEFKRGSTGPWGEDIEGDWYPYDTAREMLLSHRQDYMSLTNAIEFGFWCDWHAKK